MITGIYKKKNDKEIYRIEEIIDLVNGLEKVVIFSNVLTKKKQASLFDDFFENFDKIGG